MDVIVRLQNQSIFLQRNITEIEREDNEGLVGDMKDTYVDTLQGISVVQETNTHIDVYDNRVEPPKKKRRRRVPKGVVESRK